VLRRTQEHAIDVPTLGEYAALVLLDGQLAAEQAFPAVAAHLDGGCQRCVDDLREFRTVLMHELRWKRTELS
jgi:hypothetical protein